MTEHAPANGEHLTLAQATKLIPGRPSANCVWRWCREGVKSKTGDRVRLKHVRFGGRIFTTSVWISAFGLALAEADVAYFDRVADESETPPTFADKRSRRSTRARGRAPDRARRHHEEAERELAEAGL